MDNTNGFATIAMGVFKAIWHGFVWLLNMMFAGPPRIPMIVGAVVAITSIYFRYRFKRTFIASNFARSANNVVDTTNYWQRIRRQAAAELAMLFSILGTLMFLIGLFRSY
jgi:uncharacterized membrane protein YphA (DoxX/SURF4 family)